MVISSLGKKRVEARLRGVQIAIVVRPNAFLIDLDNHLRREHATIKCLEEEFCAMKSRLNYLMHGESNTAYYHTLVINRRKRNKITFLKDSMGSLISDESEVARYIKKWHANLHTTNTMES